MPSFVANAPSRRAQGFTLLELMIAIVIVAVLLAVALPSYRDSVRKGRRAEATAAIAAVQQAQERQRAMFPTYCDELNAAPTVTSCGLNIPTHTANGYYALALTIGAGAEASRSYQVVATAAGAQADDTRCAKLAARVLSGNVTYGSGSTTIDWTDANRCWAK